MLENHERHFEYNGLLEITEILIVRCIFELKFHQIRFLPGLRPGPRWGACKYNVPRPLLGWGEGRPSHPSVPLRRRAFQWGPGVVEWVGDTRWLIRPCSQQTIDCCWIASPAVLEILGPKRIGVMTLTFGWRDVVGHVTIQFPIGRFLFASSYIFL